MKEREMKLEELMQTGKRKLIERKRELAPVIEVCQAYRTKLAATVDAIQKLAYGVEYTAKAIDEYINLLTKDTQFHIQSFIDGARDHTSSNGCMEFVTDPINGKSYEVLVTCKFILNSAGKHWKTEDPEHRRWSEQYICDLDTPYHRILFEKTSFEIHGQALKQQNKESGDDDHDYWRGSAWFCYSNGYTLPIACVKEYLLRLPPVDMAEFQEHVFERMNDLDLLLSKFENCTAGITDSHGTQLLTLKEFISRGKEMFSDTVVDAVAKCI